MSSSGRGQKLERRGSSFHATGAAAQEQHVAYEKRLADELETAKATLSGLQSRASVIASDVAIHEAALTSLEADRETNVAQLEAEIAVLERERASYVRKKLPKWITVFEPTHAKAYYLNTFTGATQWERPPIEEGFDGTVALQDDASGLIATCRVAAIPEDRSTRSTAPPPTPNGRMSALGGLVSLQAGVLGIEDTGHGALRAAIERGVLSVINLVAKDDPAALSAPTDDGTTPLMLAAAVGNVSAAMALSELDPNFEVNTVSPSGASALTFATQHGRSEMVQWLLSANADSNVTDDHGATPLRIAAEFGHLDVVSVLLSNGASADVPDYGGVTPLSAAAERSHTDVVHRLIEAGADPNSADMDGMTPLCCAARQGDVVVTEALLNAGASPVAQARDGAPILLLAAQSGSLPVLRRLLETGKCNVNVSRLGQFTPLHIAAQLGHIAAVSLLVQHEADVNAVAEGGATPLLLAAQEGHGDVAELLLASGGRPGPKDRTGATHFDLWAEHYGFYENRPSRNEM